MRCERNHQYDAWINFSKPLVIAVNGPAIGEGFTTLMMGDIIYSSDSAYFWSPFARFGVVPEITSTVTLPQRVGPAVEHGQRLAGLDPPGHVPVAPTKFVEARVRIYITLARRAELASRKKSRFLPPRGRRGWMGSDEPPQIRRAGLRRT